MEATADSSWFAALPRRNDKILGSGKDEA